jgi:hypothetical protein
VEVVDFIADNGYDIIEELYDKMVDGIEACAIDFVQFEQIFQFDEFAFVLNELGATVDLVTAEGIVIAFLIYADVGDRLTFLAFELEIGVFEG